MQRSSFWLACAAIAVVSFGASESAEASAIKQTKGQFEDKFRQLDEVLPTLMSIAVPLVSLANGIGSSVLIMK